MTRQLCETPRAKLDFADVVDYLLAANPPAAIRFNDAYDSALQSVQKMPYAGGRLLLPGAEDLDLRYCRPAGFKNYLIFYRVTDDAIVIVRILHTSRDLLTVLLEA